MLLLLEYNAGEYETRKEMFYMLFEVDMKYKPKVGDEVCVYVKGVMPGTYLRRDADNNEIEGSPMTVTRLHQYKSTAQRKNKSLQYIEARDCNGVIRDINTQDFVIRKLK